jgi:hypothetical protein
MPRILSEIGRKLSRLFLGRIVVRSLEDDLHRAEPSTIKTHFRTVEINPMRVEPRVRSALFVKWRNTRAVSAGSLIGGVALKNFKVRHIRLRVFNKKPVYRCRLNIKERTVAKKGMRRITRTPITRRNRLNFLKTPPKFERASLLAIYSPIFQEKVAKSALDKASGNLLFWYDIERVKAGERHHLLLLRVFGGEEPLKWVWLPASKKIS